MLFRSKTAIKILSQTSQYHTHLHFNTNIGEIANFTITTITIFATFASDAKSKQTRSTLSNVFNTETLLTIVTHNSVVSQVST